MKLFSKFIINFVINLLIALFLFIIYYLKFAKFDNLSIVYFIIKSLIVYLPVISALSLLWGIITSKIGEISPFVYSFSIFIFIIIMFSFGFCLQEILSPIISNSYYDTKDFKKFNIRKEKTLKIKKEDEILYFTNITFFLDNDIIINIDELIKYNNNFNGKGFKYFIIEKNRIKHIITSSRFNIKNDKIIIYDPITLELNNEKLVSKKQIKGLKIIPLMTSIYSIIDIEKEKKNKEISLLSLIKNIDYITDSKINFYNFGNILYNKISYYIILILMMIMCVIFGFKYKIRKEITNEYFQLVCFYIISFVICLIIYESIIQAFNFIYYYSI